MRQKQIDIQRRLDIQKSEKIIRYYRYRIPVSIILLIVGGIITWFAKQPILEALETKKEEPKELVERQGETKSLYLQETDTSIKDTIHK